MAARRARWAPYEAVLRLIHLGTDDTVWPHLQVDADRAGISLLSMPLWRWCAWAYAHLTAGLDLQQRSKFDRDVLAAPVTEDEQRERWGLDDESAANLAALDRQLAEFGEADDLSYLPDDVREAFEAERRAARGA